MKLLWLIAQSWAEERGAEGVHEVVIPWNSVMVQALNLAIVLGLLIYLLRKPIQQHFAERAASYRQLVDRAEVARKEAEHNRAQAQERLTKLEASAAQSATRATQEAGELRKRLLDEAKVVARKFEEEAVRATAVELDKSKNELRRELLAKSLAASHEMLKKSLGTVDQQKLQLEFAEKIEVVGG